MRKGDLLAVIETPELDQQLAQAKADLATAQSNAALAKVTADRYRGLIAQNAVSQQDTDNAISQLEARSTEVNSAQANVHRLEELQSFERIEAPFDGVITARNLDIGQLVTPPAAPPRRARAPSPPARRSSTSPPSARCASSSTFPRSTRRMRRTESRPP